MNLSSLKPGEEATITAVNADEALFHRLAAMGLRVGKRVQLVRSARFSGPLHVRIGTTDILLRRQEARKIAISDCPESGEPAPTGARNGLFKRP